MTSLFFKILCMTTPESRDMLTEFFLKSKKKKKGDKLCIMRLVESATHSVKMATSTQLIQLIFFSIVFQFTASDWPVPKVGNGDIVTGNSRIRDFLARFQPKKDRSRPPAGRYHHHFWAGPFNSCHYWDPWVLCDHDAAEANALNLSHILAFLRIACFIRSCR